MSKFLRDRNTFREKSLGKKIEEYKSLIDYEKYELNAEDLKSMINYEKEVIFHNNKAKEHLISLSETLYKAQQLLANYKNGGFREWFETLGLKKDFVYMCLKRYNLYLDYKDDKVMMIPEVIIKDISKKNLTRDNVLEILNDEAPQKKYKEIKQNILSGDPTIYSGDIQEAEIVEEGEIKDLEKKLAEKYRHLKELNKEIKDLEYRLEILRKRI